MRHEDESRLLEFIEASKAKGASDEFLASFLTRRGWPQNDVYAALGRFWEQATGLAVPDRVAGSESSRDAFLYLLSFSTLATWSSALGSMLFRFIEHWFPDPIVRDQVYNLRNAVTWQMASVAVAFPIFAIVMRVILKEARGHPERLESGVRKWLTYIALFVTAVVMICDLIWVFSYFLKGELSTRFLLKAFTVMLISTAIFVYYLGSLRWDRNTNVIQVTALSRQFAVGAAAVLLASFCVGLGITGTPSEQRHLEADQRRIDNLRGIAGALNSWHTRVLPLPNTLSELVGYGVNDSDIADPETKIPYEYRVKSGDDYELCATFSGSEGIAPYQNQFWRHQKGRTCYALNASRPATW
jgi:Domain of unknown function (DUF5671)